MRIPPGMKRYLKPKLMPIYGILFGYIIILFFRLFAGIKLYLIEAFYIGSHMVTIADILIVTGAVAGLVLWKIKNKGISGLQ